MKKTFWIRITILLYFPVLSQNKAELNSFLLSTSRLDSCMINFFNSEKNGEQFSILHLGDSHVQGPKWGMRIRDNFAGYLPTGKSGFFFPYKEVKSYSPKGLSSLTEGTWHGGNWLRPGKTETMSFGGYALTLIENNGSLFLQFDETFWSKKTNSIALWYKGKHPVVDSSWKKTAESSNKNGINYSIYTVNEKVVGRLESRSIRIRPDSVPWTFLGGELITSDSGLVYHKCGVVGAQLTHLLTNVKNIEEDIKELHPQLVILSFGTNEAYNDGLDTLVYENKLAQFMQKLNFCLPSCAFLVTTPPNTKSTNRNPKYEDFMVRVLKRQSQLNNWAVFDLFTAMGGKNSWTNWLKSGLMAKDQLHFSSTGYELQGDLLSAAILERIEITKGIILERNRNLILQTTKRLDEVTSFQNEIKHEPADEEIKTEPSPKKFYAAKKGDTLYSIAKKYRIKVQKIKQLNNLKSDRIVKGQKLRIRE